MDDCQIGSLNNKIHEQSEEILKLRRLVVKLRRFDQLGCHTCPYEPICDNPIFRDCLMDREIDRDMQDLGLGLIDKEENNGE